MVMTGARPDLSMAMEREVAGERRRGAGVEGARSESVEKNREAGGDMSITAERLSKVGKTERQRDSRSTTFEEFEGKV